MTRRTLRQLFFFSLAGAVGFVVDVGVLLGLENLGVNLLLARLVSFLFAATTTWLMNRKFTFHHAVRLSDKSLRREYGQYMAAMSFGGLINYGVFAFLVVSVALIRSHPTLGVLAGTLAGVSFNFMVSKHWIFSLPDSVQRTIEEEREQVWPTRFHGPERSE